MDMITKIQLEDAVNNDKIVRARIEEVARVVGQMEGSFNEDSDPKDWRLDSYYYDFKNKYDPSHSHLINHQVKAKMTIRYSNRPNTKKFGDPEEDNEYYSSDEYLSRYIDFPKAYLFTDDWLPRAEAMAVRHKAIWAKIHADHMVDDIKKAEAEVIRLKARLIDLTEKSVGYDLVIE